MQNLNKKTLFSVKLCCSMQSKKVKKLTYIISYKLTAKIVKCAKVGHNFSTFLHTFMNVQHIHSHDRTRIIIFIHVVVALTIVVSCIGMIFN